MTTRLADEGLNTTKWVGRGSGITSPGIITYQMDQICQFHATTVCLLFRVLQDVQLTGYICRNGRDGEKKFLAACRENIRWRPKRSLVITLSELSPC